MDIKSTPALLIIILLSLVLTSYAHPCPNYNFPYHRLYKSGIDLAVLDAHLHRNYISSTGTVDIAYRTSQTTAAWVAWAVNPNATGMLGSQALVAFHNPNGSLAAYSTLIESFTPLMQPGALRFEVSNISATYVDNEMIIFALLGHFKMETPVNHV